MAGFLSDVNHWSLKSKITGLAAGVSAAVILAKVVRAQKEKGQKVHPDDYPLKIKGQDFPVSSFSQEAVVWVRRGFQWIDGFHLEEAAYCFAQALRWDPAQCPIAHWGLAYTTKPWYNVAGPAGFYQDKWSQLHSGAREMEKAMQKLHFANNIEKALIEPMAAFLQAPFNVAAQPGALVRRLQQRIEKLPTTWKNRTSPPDMTGPAWMPCVNQDAKALLQGLDYFDVFEPRERAYAEAMFNNFQRMQSTGEAGPSLKHLAFFAIDSLLLEHPWAFYEPQAAKAHARIQPVIEAALKEWPLHAGLCHLHVHFHELGPTPQLAVASADRLASGVGGDADGHLLHMSGHILAQLGRHNDSMMANLKAREADIALTRRRPDTSTFNWILGGTLHNIDFVVWGAMNTGQKAIALKYARELYDATSPMFLMMQFAPLPAYDVVYFFFSYYYWAHIRFGMWREILEMPIPWTWYDLHHVFVRFARGVAFAALGRVAEAEAELAAYRSLATQAHFGERRVAIVYLKTLDILKVEEPWLDGEIEYRKGNYERAFELLRTAVRLEEELGYMEAPAFPIPPRHALAALLMEQKRFKEAEQVYKEDLEVRASPRGRHPDSIWSLAGLERCLKQRSAPQHEVNPISEKLRAAKVIAPDFNTQTSCACAVQDFR